MIRYFLFFFSLPSIVPALLDRSRPSRARIESMSRRHRARAQRTRDRPRASSHAPPSRMNPRLERDDRTHERINTRRRRHARGARSRPIASPSRARCVHECARGTTRDESRGIINHHPSSVPSSGRRHPPRRDANAHTKKKKTKKTDDASRRRTTDVPRRRRRRRHAPPHHHPRARSSTHTPGPTDPRVRPTARPTDRATNHPSDRPTAFFFLFFSERPARPDRARECVSG